MTDKELRKLSRLELLEMLVEQSREVEQLRTQLAQARQQLESRQITVDRAGTLAEAALQLNGVFDAAQQAAEQYLENIRELSGRQDEVCQRLKEEGQAEADRILAQARQECQAMEAETQAKCDKMLAQAEAETRAYWNSVSRRVGQLNAQQTKPEAEQ